MYAALDHTSYDFWLFEPTEELSVTIDYSGQESLTTGNLRIVETNLLWTRYLTILLAISALILWTLWYQKRDAQKEEKERRHVVIFGIGVIAFLASIPYLYDGMISFTPSAACSSFSQISTPLPSASPSALMTTGYLPFALM